MSLKELQESVLALPQNERVQFFRWVHSQEEAYGDVDPEAVAQMVSEYWDQESKDDAAKRRS